jgi:DNA-binding beta-propeller fold protein YncE
MAGCSAGNSTRKAPNTVGKQAGGDFLLNSGWRLTPAGESVALDTLPMSLVTVPGGKDVLVLNGGFNPPSLSLVSSETRQERQRLVLGEAWLGLSQFSASGRVYISGGASGDILEIGFELGKLAILRRLPVRAPGKAFVGDVALSADGRSVLAALVYMDRVARIDIESGATKLLEKAIERPYRILPESDGAAWISSWSGKRVVKLNRAGKVELEISTGPHPTDLLVSRKSSRLFVATANTNFVEVYSLTGSTPRLLEKISVGLTARQPAGMTPSALSLNKSETSLYVACSDANAIAVADVSAERSRVLGFVPTGWYPTAVTILPSGVLAYLSSRGLQSYANPRGQTPFDWSRDETDHSRSKVDYTPRIQHGAISFVPAFDEKRLVEFTRLVRANSPYEDAKLDVDRKAAELPTIEHVVYILKENRTYDQIFGDLKEGNGDPSLTLFGEEVTPNHHKLAREFVLFDNFYVNSDVSADGLFWSTAAIAPDFVQKTWPSHYAHRHRVDLDEPARDTPSGYLWTAAIQKGLSVRNYGFFAENFPLPAKDGVHVKRLRDRDLDAPTNRRYRGKDSEYSDVDRVRVFLEEVAEFEQRGTFPRLVTMTLGNDHTAGTTPGWIAPRSAVADNDLALGQLIEGLSKTRFWPKMAIFVLEDDAQDGPDHVDSHRSIAFVISPHARRKAVDSNVYNTASVLRTMELLLGLPPMTMFDAAAAPMTSAFVQSPNMDAYRHVPARISLSELNPPQSATAARSKRLDFRDADLADDRELNDILYLAIQGRNAPAPTRSLFSK